MAKIYYTQACEGNNLIGCSNLGALESQKGKKSESKKYNLKACEGGEIIGCSNMGYLEEELGNKKSAETYFLKVKEMAKKQCDDGNRAACAFIKDSR